MNISKARLGRVGRLCLALTLSVPLLDGSGRVRAARLQLPDGQNPVLIRIAPLQYENDRMSFIVREDLLRFANGLAGGRADAGERNYEVEHCDKNPDCDVVTIAQVSREFRMYVKDGQGRRGEYPQTWLCTEGISNDGCPTHSITHMKRMLRAHRRDFHP